jgi:Ser/Thr protein kinase RdoA (MazF antagonist)
VPDLKQRLATRIDGAERLGRDLRDALLRRLAAMPDGDRLCHGDFHPFNILGLDARARIIDWLDASRGVAAADICRTYVLVSAHDPQMAAAYVDAYGIERAQLEAWLPLVAAARLVENVPREYERLAQLAQGGSLG